MTVSLTLRSDRPQMRRLAPPAGLALLGVLLPLPGRPLALLWPIALAIAVGLLVRSTGPSAAQATVATFVGLLPATIVTAAVHDLLGFAPAAPVSATVLLLLWSAAAVTLGTEVATRVRGGLAHADVWVRVLAVTAVTGFIGAALGRLLLESRTAADRLGWAIWEEDNAQIVGIAREVITGGPRGAELADQYGTAFINLPLLLMRMFGGPITGEVDPRLQAITVFTVSTLVAIVLAGLAMALLAALPHHVHARPGASAPGPLTIAAGAAATGVAALIGFSMLVVLPMRTGFLTFVWGLMLVLVGAALVAATPSDAGPAARLVLVAHLVSLVVLLLSSWPFIAPALAPLLLVPLLWIRWSSVRASLRRHRGRWLGGVGVALVALGLVAYWFSRWGPAAEVLSYGLDILLIGASGIGADRPAELAARTGIIVAVGLIVLTARPGARLQLSLGVIGPVLGGGALYLGLRVAAALLTDGQLNYAGIKLFYGVLTLAIVLGLLTLASAATRLGLVGTAAVLAAVVVTHQVSDTASLHTEWWDRTDLGAHAHVEATVDAIQRTSPDLPIRCLPAPGTVVTPTSQWAAYTCARWMEDAFNEGRFAGHRFDLMNARGPTFEETVERILIDSQSEYLFAHRFTMGPGWFGWTGPGS